MLIDCAAKAMNAVHRGVLKVSGGKAGWQISTMPILRLTTVGRKTGEPRSVMLASPLQEGSTLVVVASRGGDDKHPAWFLNLRENPQVDVTYRGGPTRRMQARTATPEERSRLWPLVVANHQNYADYQTKTTREIPLVLLEDLAS
ncbi:nitroreductase family deazaflavin-dependent oxidoreductase [Kribbella sp. NBC_01505]|uniref:nitroreductase/quinone reductase family protein n=1 Tax=Kribbella sp. NBC_01505 TaxID=2903580 RepID=UPI00386E2106